MLPYLLRRLAASALTLTGIVAVTFTLMHAVPGGPFEVLAGDAATPGLIAAQEAAYGLDRPLPEQFARTLGNLLRGDLGISFAQRGQPVTELLAPRVRTSAILGMLAFVLVIAAGIPAGVFTATRRGSSWDLVGLGMSTALAALPSFVLAFLLLLVFAIGLGWTDVRPGEGFGTSASSLRHAVLPAFALAAPSMALLARITRAALIEVLDADYVRTARAKGLDERAVVWRHGLRNALVPVLTLAGPVFANLIVGSIIIESIFGLPGVGSLFVTAIAQRDYGVIMGITLFYAVVVLAVNLAVDLLYPVVDPRVRLA